MPDISAVNSNGTATAAAPNAFNELSSEEFVKIMFAELTNQDPLKPNDSTQMLEQLSSLRSIQSDMNLTDKLESILTQNQLSTAGSLIGKYVSGITSAGQRVVGEVVSVARNADGPILRLSNNFLLPFDNVDIMENPPAPAAPPQAG